MSHMIGPFIMTAYLCLPLIDGHIKAELQSGFYVSHVTERDEPEAFEAASAFSRVMLRCLLHASFQLSQPG